MSTEQDDNIVLPENPTDNTTETEALLICAFSQCTEQNVQVCRKCHRPFCVMHANRFSPNFCWECFRNLSVVESKFRRTFEDFDTKTDKLHIRQESCTKYHMDGPDWPFLNAWIDELSDEELRAVWNFNFFVMKTIEAENETRRIENAAKIRNNPSTKLITGTVKQTATATVRVTKPVDTVDDVRKKLKKSGLPDAVIDQMIAAMGVK